MPAAAVQSGGVDLILPLAAVAPALISLVTKGVAGDAPPKE
jgi:chemotaxis response regulator CheB